MVARVSTWLLAVAFLASLLWAAFIWWMAPQGISDHLSVTMHDYKGDGSAKSLARYVAPLVHEPVSDLILIAAAPMTVAALAGLALSVALGRGWIAGAGRPAQAPPGAPEDGAEAPTSPGETARDRRK